MARVEQQLTTLEYEANAQKVAYEQAATSLPVFTVGADFTTTRNELQMTYGAAGRTENGIERVIVTLDTESGANTLATLELSTDADSAPNIRRTVYKGGARWIVTNQPKVQSGSWQSGTWEATHYHFQVQSLVRGSLSVESMTS